MTKTQLSRKSVSKASTTKKRANASPPFPHIEGWTTAKFWSFIRSGLRAKWMRWPPKFTVLKSAQRKSLSANKKLQYEYQCSECRSWFPQKEVEVDHIIPAGSLKDYSDLPGFVERLFVGVDGLRVVCKPCHKQITQEARDNAG